MSDPRLHELQHHGQSVWLDQLQRDWLHDGTLAGLVADGVRGVTSNPSIFAAAMATSDSYAAEIATLAAAGQDAAGIYDALTLDDIRGACDALGPTYQSTAGADGFVSHEVSPELAHRTIETVQEARRLWAAVDRPNLLIKIPATPAGLPAIERALAEGINVNVTLMFNLRQYEGVAEAFLRGLESRVAAGADVSRVASVASFFVSRVDTTVDKWLSARLEPLDADGPEAARIRGLLGRAAVANAARAYARALARFSGPRWAALEAQGARRQRVLWASTSTKNPAYSDVKYVAELVAPHTVNTVPLETLAAWRDHGAIERVIDGSTTEADATVSALGALGIDLEDVGDGLLTEGVAKFAASFREALATVDDRRREVTA